MDDLAELRPDPVDYRASREVIVPSSKKARAAANIAAIKTIRVIELEDRYATPDEQDVIAQWSGWGAVPKVFDPRRDDFAAERAELESLLSSTEWNRARHTILNAHYTDPAVVAETWNLLRRAGFQGGLVLEPGSGSGTFLGHAPADAQMVGVELDTLSARVAASLYPSAQVRNESFADTAVPDNAFVASIGNVPFGDIKLWDDAHNRAQHSIHNHFILKSLDLTAPGGYVALLTSRFTADAAKSDARRAMADRADLIGGARLPSGAFRRVAGTEVVTDLLVFRVRDEGQEPSSTTREFIGTSEVPVELETADGQAPPVPIRVNNYFLDHPEQVLGTLSAGHGMYGNNEQRVLPNTDTPLDQQIAAALGPVIDAAVLDGRGMTASRNAVTYDASLAVEKGLITPVEQWSEVPVDALRHNADLNVIERFNGTGWSDSGCPQSRTSEWRSLLELRDTFLSLIEIQRDGGDAADKDALRAALNDRYDAYVTRYGFINRFTWAEPRAVTQDLHDKRLVEALDSWITNEGRAFDAEGRDDVPDEVYSRLDDEAWIPTSSRTKRAPHLVGAIRNDPHFQSILSLESFDEQRMIGRKAAVFTTDVLEPARPIEHADTIHDALALCMDESATVNVDRIAELLGTDNDNVEAQLQSEALAFRSTEDPATWIPRTRYLSGNVRVKLAEAETAANNDDRYRANATALRGVIPARIEDGITARLGVTWVSPDDYKQFITDTFRIDKSAVTVDYVNNEWVVEGNSYYAGYAGDALAYGLVPQKGSYSSSGYNFVGTDREQRLSNQGVSLGRDRSGTFDHWQVLESLMNSRPIAVNRSKEYKEAVPNGGDVHAGATRAAKQRAERLQEAFADWALHGDPERRERLLTEYNWRFNATVAPAYDGSGRTFPGLGKTFSPYPYQRDAVERLVNEPTVLLNHVVGAGKTGTMLMGAMELKRLGLVRQPWIVVPNHIVDQVAREAAQWYPAANVLSGAGRTTRDDRQKLLAQSAAQDWDMVIVPLSAFTRMNTSGQTRATFIDGQLTAMRTALLEAGTNGGTAITIKQIEKAIKRLEGNFEKALNSAKKDDGITFEQSGADYLFIDEAHLYKNLGRTSGVQELSHPGSEQAMDLKLKLDYLRDRKRQEASSAGIPADAYVERVACFASGTPVANSLAELWVMQTYLRPDMLAHAGVESIDAWGQNFTDTTETVELNASGTKLRSVTRVGQFANVGDLVGMVSQFTDAVTRDQVPVNLPAKRSGTNIVVDFEPSQEVKDFIQDLGHRADTVDPKRMDLDNSLKIANDGRNVSLDPRSAHLAAPAEGGRAREVAGRILHEWAATRDNVYLDDIGEESETRGGLQIVFCDRSVPKKDGRWNIYEGIKGELVAGGLPADQIAFVHDYPKPDDKAALFQQCRNGQISVLIGSTEKMGTGTNVQTRAVALHHVDVPWRPADLEQREGRIIRQGNQTAEVAVYNYVATATYDTAMWQTLNRKAAFLDQLYRADRSIRSIEDLSSDNLAESTALVKAIATGDDRYLRRVELERDLAGLDARRESHVSEMRSRRSEIAALTRSIPNDEKRLRQLETAAPTLQAWAEQETKAYTVGPTTFTVRKDASDQLLETLREAYVQLRGAGPNESSHVATFADVPLHITRVMEHDMVILRFGDLPMAGISITQEQLWPQRDDAHFGRWGAGQDETLDVAADEAKTNRAAMANGVMTRIENAIGRAPGQVEAARSELQTDRRRLDELHNTPDEPFPEAAKLQTMKTELEGINDQLAAYENSDAAKHARDELDARLLMKGRTDGWSLMLNPTPALVEDLGFETADEVREMMRHREIEALETWAATAPIPQPDQPRSTQPVAEPGGTVDLAEVRGQIMDVADDGKETVSTDDFTASYLEHRSQEQDTDADPGWHGTGSGNQPEPDYGPET
ncbi:DEAD/DEAH box helicase family protein [Rhodococcus sp. IEGM 1408]|uniref:DEAD/DEAH box helicase family protein n=1 Tax=Rhodococcus sp. IEGM 1408 TaxID=3082220 RepID=UPI0029546D05|nr:DEAD/DEAH box helicase family protein [Rhodococcus sp. IEGM 1408]MDV8002868.1 DEAD/DEAH box helicase family protein [Rhodococcus sp. IEGM 1408]